MEFQLPRAHAPELLGISERQLCRVLAAYRRDGAVALVHGNRGRKPRHITQPVGSTQFTRAGGELGIEQIFAWSPQVKGRVERMVGTFQDRLVSELRLAGTANIDQANAVLRDFLPRFNAQFRVPAQRDQAAYRSLPTDIFAGQQQR